MAADAWELRTARLEGAYEQIGGRLGAVEGRLSTLEHKMDTGFAQVRAEIAGLRDETHSDITGLRNALRSEITGLRNELRPEITGLRTELLGRMDRQFSRADRQFYWLLGIMLSGFLAIGLTLTGH
ncbi:MAG: hypothetical protein ACYDAB_17095 [bacterium]